MNPQQVKLEQSAATQNTQDGITSHMGNSARSFVGTGHEPSLWDQTVQFVATYNSLILWAGIITVAIYLLIKNHRAKTIVK